MSTPRVTVGVPVWNGARHVEECLDSLLAQTYDDIEVVISDNASTDRTPEICRAYCARDERVTYHRQPRNIGAAANYNFLVHKARSELFKWAAHDDVCAPKFVELCVAALDSSPTDVLAFPRTTFIDGSGAALPHPDPAPHADAEDDDVPMCWRNDANVCGRLRDLLVGDLLMGDYRATLLLKCTAQFGVIRRSALERTRLTGNYNSSDVVLLVELALLGGFAAVDECLFLSRIHEGSSLRANTKAADVARWYDPRRGDRYPMPWTRVLHGLVTAVLNSSLSYSDKANALTLVTRWFFGHGRWRMIGGELKIRAREVVAARALLDRAES